MQLIGTIIVFLLGIAVGVGLYLSGWMQYFPDYIYTPQSTTVPYQAPVDQTSYQPQTYPNQPPANTSYPGYQSQPQSSYNSGSTYAAPPSDALRLNVLQRAAR
jgi:hypothetical protein